MRNKVFASLFFIGCITIFLIEEYSFVKNNINFLHVENRETTVERYFPLQGIAKEIYGFSNRIISPNEKISELTATVKDKNGYLESIQAVTFDVNFAKEKICELNNVCNESGAEFSYISYPSKTNSDTKSIKYGIETDYEFVRKDFLDYLDKQDIDYLDVRKLLENDGFTTRDIFYKTDHHWKTPAGFYAAHSIAKHLNDEYGYTLNVNALDESNFTFKTYENLWFGETGRSLSRAWVGALDDFTEIIPNYDTSLTITGPDGNEVSGDFKIMVNESGYETDIDYYSYSAHYSYSNHMDSPSIYHNNLNVNGKKILIIKDSFSVVVIPFLILATSDITVWDMRADRTKEGLYDYIRNDDVDVVLVAYTDFWRKDVWNFN